MSDTSDNLDKLNTQIQTQVLQNGSPLFYGAADNPATQAAIGGLISTLAGFPIVKQILCGVEARVFNNVVGASGPPITDNAGNTSQAALGVQGAVAPFDIIVASNDRTGSLKGDSGTDLIIAGSKPTQIIAGAGTDYLIGGQANTTIVGGPGPDTFVDDISSISIS